MPTADATINRLYELLPAIHRLRDQEQGQPLRALLQVIAEQVNLIEDDIRSLYDNWFIETCDDWVVPYLADLIGYTPVPEAGLAGDPSSAEGRRHNRALTPRREVANTLRYRLRKGTLAVLELLARDVAGMTARAVEFDRLLAASASMNSPGGSRTVDVRRSRSLDRLGGAFDEAAYLPEVRRIVSQHASGRHDAAGVGLFVWRLRSCSVTHVKARRVDDAGPNCYTFSLLGNDAPLFNKPRDSGDDDGEFSIAGELDVPDAISCRAFTQPTMLKDGRIEPRASADYYPRCLAIWALGWPPGEADEEQPVPRYRIVPADLDHWHYVPREGTVAVDPERGRIVFPPRQMPSHVYVTYHYGFSADLGGGEYERPLSQENGAEVIRVKGKDELEQALKRWKLDTGSGGTAVIPADQPAHAVIEIADSGVYTLPISISLGEKHSLQIRAAQHTRPVVRLLDWETDQPDGLAVTGLTDSRFVLDGVIVAGQGVRLSGALRSFTLRHATLVPGWTLEPNCDPKRPAEPSVEMSDCQACIVIEHSIVGSIQVNNDEVDAEPVQIRISDSVVDATGTDCSSPECEAIGAAGSGLAHAVLRIARSTVIGRVMCHAIGLAENSILLGCVTAARRQIGCIRFCYVPQGSRTPRRFHCQRVRPRFNSTRYGTPTYCQLADDCPHEIARGADDESEMGVFHDLFQAQRLANLRARLEEFVPAATDAVVIVAN